MKTRESVLPTSKSKRRMSQSVLQRFRNSKFYTSAIIISNFMLLIIIPDCAFTLYLHISNTTPPFAARAVLTLMNLMSDLCDFVIYVFIQKKVRQLLFKKVCSRRKPKKNVLLRRERAMKRSGAHNMDLVNEKCSSKCMQLWCIIKWPFLNGFWWFFFDIAWNFA